MVLRSHVFSLRSALKLLSASADDAGETSSNRTSVFNLVEFPTDFWKHISEDARCLPHRSDWTLSQEKWKLKLQVVDTISG